MSLTFDDRFGGLVCDRAAEWALCVLTSAGETIPPSPPTDDAARGRALLLAALSVWGLEDASGVPAWAVDALNAKSRYW